MSHKVAVIGWDGADFDVIHALVHAGALPNLQRLMARGGWGRLQSTLHPLSPVAWASFMTGMNPGRHGVFDFVGLGENGRFRFANGGSIRAETLWARMSGAGRRVCVINVPMTYPPEELNGCIISGMDSPRIDRPFTHPPALGDELVAQFGHYRTDVSPRRRLWMPVGKFSPRYVEALCDAVRLRGQVACHLLERCDPDLLVAVFTATDRVQHALGDLMAGQVSPDDGIGQVYRACDRALGSIDGMLDDDWVVFVMSDHGACAYRRVFELSSWLVAQGWLKVRSPWLTRPLGTWAGPVRRIASRVFLPPAKRTPGREQFLNRIVWEDTQAFAVGAFGSIYVNLRGRYPGGVVDPGKEYEEVCERISRELLSMRDPETGDLVVRAVYRKGEVYRGPWVHLAPDLLVETSEAYFVRNSLDQFEGKVLYRAGRYRGRSLPHTGRHTPYGVLVAAGVPVGVGEWRSGARIIDVAPTVLHLGGLSLPFEMDGEPLLDWLTRDYCRAHPVVRLEKGAQEANIGLEADPYNEREAASVEARLRDLGYID